MVAPITEASAEYQAIAYALDTPGVELVLVDRSSDHVFQWDARGAQAAEDRRRPDERRAEEEAALHGDAVGVEIGDLRPRFAELEEHLLRHGRVRHWSEWWDQYVELPLGDSDHDTYRQVMFLIGSLFRRLAPGDPHQVARGRGPRALHVDPDARAPGRDRHRPGGLPVRLRRLPRGQPRSREFGVDGTDAFEISPRTATTLAVRPDPVQPRGDRGAVRPGRGLGVDRRDGLGEERQAHRRHAVPAGRAGGREEARRQEGRRRTPAAAASRGASAAPTS